ncbi:MAG: acetamidase/formamidase family protein [Eubacteriales bacterium]
MVRISSSNSIFKMSPSNNPVANVDTEEIVVFETLDCFSNYIQREEQLFSSVGWNLINPATGPIYINGAEPNDTLKVEILDIKVADQGVICAAPNFGVLGEIITEEVTKVIPVREGKAIFNDKIHLSIKPMIGVIGTSPAREEIPTGTPGNHGSNMDCKRIVKGSVLYLPVNVPGGLLAMGDLHAVMGDGEIVVCGLEISGEVTVRVTVLKELSLPLPMLQEGDSIMTLASSATLDEAAKLATMNMHSFLIKQLNMDIVEAGMLLSLAGDLRICQVVDPLMTARMELPLWILGKYDYRMP